MIIDKILGNLNNYKIEGKEIDYVELDHFDMAKPHQKVKAKSGRVFPVSLEKGEILKKGDVIFEDEKTVVVMEMAFEDVIEVTPKNNMEWGRAAFNIGNMHQSAYIYDDKIRIPYDYIMESLLKNLGVSFERKSAKLDGIKANVSVKEHSGQGHSHSHSHSHGNGHSHSHGDHSHGGHSHE